MLFKGFYKSKVRLHQISVKQEKRLNQILAKKKSKIKYVI